MAERLLSNGLGAFQFRNKFTPKAPPSTESAGKATWQTGKGEAAPITGTAFGPARAGTFEPPSGVKPRKGGGLLH